MHLNKTTCNIAKTSVSVVVAVACLLPLSGCVFGGAGSSNNGNETAVVQQGPVVFPSNTNGPNRVPTSGIVGTEATGYITVPVSWKDFGGGFYAEQHSAFTSSIDGRELFSRAVEMHVVNRTYAETAHDYINICKENTQLYRDVKSYNGQFKGNAAVVIEGRADDKMYFKTIIFDAGNSSDTCRVVTGYYLREYEKEVLDAVDSWSATPTQS